MRSYWENYAKAVDPLNYKRKMESQAEETHAESTSDKVFFIESLNFFFLICMVLFKYFDQEIK